MAENIGDALPVLHDLDELLELVRGEEDGAELYARWSRGSDTDGTGGAPADPGSQDALTGVPLPGLSANPLRVESWWGNRSRALWLARKLFDYQHLRELRGGQVRAWILTGAEWGAVRTTNRWCVLDDRSPGSTIRYSPNANT